MTVSAVTPPTPPNSNLDRSMFVWVGTAGSSGDPLSTDAKMQSLLNFCATNGVNLLYLDIWGYLGGGNWSTTHAATVQKFIHYAHASGIQVWALAGNTDWQHNQQWVMNNIVRHILMFQGYSEASSTTNIAGQFDGVMLDVEYWAQAGGYTTDDVVGLVDLVKAMKRVLNMPVGCAMSQWQADSTSAALTVTYNGDTALEGLIVSRNVDAVAVMSYSNNASGTDGATQIAMFSNWFNDASVTGADRNHGLWCVSLTMTGQPAGQSYSGETKAKMEQNHTAISAAFTASPNTNACFRGQGIQDYASYSGMS